MSIATPQDWRNRFTCLDIEALDEVRLFTLVRANPVSAVFDLRARPFFDRPKFAHRAVVWFLLHHDVTLLEHARLRERDTTMTVGIRYPEAARARVQAALKTGLVLCVSDAGARSSGVLRTTRRMMTQMGAVELHPGALRTTMWVDVPDGGPGEEGDLAPVIPIR